MVLMEILRNIEILKKLITSESGIALEISKLWIDSLLSDFPPSCKELILLDEGVRI